MNSVARLQKWYASQCDGTWEHSFGIKIESLDNPGWRVAIDLQGTALADKPFAGVAAEYSPDNWVRCSLRDRAFVGAGGVGNLEEILRVFVNWAGIS